jgi:hypothetical protein
MLGTAKTSRSFTGAQYIVKIFLCQTFCEKICKKTSVLTLRVTVRS